MAPMPEDVYLPSLEKCLKDETLLLSWRNVYSSVHASPSSIPPGVAAFLADQEALNLLKRPLNPFLPPGNGTKSQFDHRTAAINITPDDSAPYKLTEIKEDALWLSKEAGVDEVVALRVAVLEWQRRPAMALLARSLDMERTIEAETEEDERLNGSMFRPNGASTAKESTTREQQTRRARLIGIYHEEKAYLLATSRLIFSLRNASLDQRRTEADIVSETATALDLSFLPQDSGSAFVQQAVKSLREALTGADKFFGILESLSHSQGSQKSLNDSLLLQIISILELVIMVADASSTLLSSDAVEEFYKLMLETGYFASVIAAAAESSPVLRTILQLNVSLAGLAVLKLPDTLVFTSPEYEDRAVLQAQESQAYYICSQQCVKTLQDALIVFAENYVSPAALGMLAWVIIVASLARFANVSGQLRDDDEQDEDELQTHPLIQRDHWRTRQLVQAYQEITGGSRFGEALNILAASATSNLSVFQQVSAIMSMLDQHYGRESSLRQFVDTCQSTLFDLFDQSLSLVQYSAETIGAFLSILGGDSTYWSLHERKARQATRESIPDYIAAQVEAGNGTRFYFDEMRYRYPREMGPFHQFIRALLLNSTLSEQRVQTLIEYITRANSFMLRLPAGFSGYREDPSNTDLGPDDIPYRLIQALPFFHSKRAGYAAQTLAITDGTVDGQDDVAEMSLPSGSLGTLITEGRPPTICFGKDFSPLRYMLGALCTHIPGNDFVDVSTGEPVPVEDVVDILELLATTLLAAHKAGAEGVNVLDELYTPAEPDRNLLEIVAELFEAHLIALTASGSGAEEGSLDLLIAGVHFFHAVALTSPARLWALLARSRLLEIDGRGGLMATVVAGIEMVRGRYEFLISCIKLYDALVDASLWSGGPTSNGETRALTRFSERRAHRGMAESLPQRMASTVITCFTRTLLEVFVNSRSWRYTTHYERAEISSRLAGAFNKVLRYVYGFDDAPEPHSKAIVSVLADAGIVVRDVLLGDVVAHSLASAIVDMLLSGVQGIETPERATFGAAVNHEVDAAVELSISGICLRATVDGSSVSVLEKELYAAAPVLVRLFACSERYKRPVARLIERLITAPSPDGDAPSLLGNLSPASAKDFLVVLGGLDKPFEDVDTEREVWKMLSAVVGSKQQWFAISLLTGRIPKDRSSRRNKEAGAKDPPARTISLFSHALNALSDVTLVAGRPVWNRLPPELALEVLRFVAACQNHWAWAVSELRSHPKFIDAITSGYVRHLHRETNDATMSLAMESCIASVIGEILAMYLHSAAQLGDAPNATKKVQEHLQYFSRFGSAQPRYSKSLHSNLQNNLAKQHRGLKLEGFKHTTVFPHRLGANYFYDVPFASKVLDVRRTAKGKQLRGLEEDLRKANEELSFVDAQVKLVEGWRVLACVLGEHVRADHTLLVGLLVDVVRNCLEENANAAGFENLRVKRAELARTLLQKLVTLEVKEAGLQGKMRKLFSICWDTLRQGGWEWETVFAGQDVGYYRTLLQILFLTLAPLSRPDPNAKRDPNATPPAQASELLEVLVFIVIKGFKSLTSVLHEDTSLAQPADFALLTAILQGLLKIPGIDLLFTQFALHFANNGSANAATSLFSWADQPAFLLGGGSNGGDDPVYAELAILFLLEMSSIPAVAEGLAVEGVLAQLASARIMRLFARPRGMGPFDPPARLHSIWARGILPLCLNLLDAVGAPIAAEVVSFLNGFPNQLARVAAELANRNAPVGTRPSDSHISLSLAAETHSLALLWRVIESYRAAGPSAGTLGAEIPALEIDTRAIREDVEDFVVGRSVLGAVVVPASEREGEMVRVKAAGGVGEGRCANRLEEMVLREFVGAGMCLGGTEA